MGYFNSVLGQKVGFDLLARRTGLPQLPTGNECGLDSPGLKSIMLSGVAAIDGDSRVVDSRESRAQTRFILNVTTRELEGQEAEWKDTCQIRAQVASLLSADRFRVLHDERARVFDPDHDPAGTLGEATRLFERGPLIEIDANAVFARSAIASDQSKSPSLRRKK